MSGDDNTGAVEGTRLWEPSAEVIAAAQVTRYMAWLRERDVPVQSYDELWRWSVAEIDAFWDSIWSYFGVRGSRGDGPVRAGGPMPTAARAGFPMRASTSPRTSFGTRSAATPNSAWRSSSTTSAGASAS